MPYESKIPDVKKQLSEVEERALNLIGELVEGKAKLLAPVGLSGELRNKIDHKIFVDGDDKGVAIGTDLDYGIYVEKGTGIYAVEGNGRKDPWWYFDPLDGEFHYTHGQHPQPFLEPAATENIDKIKDIVTKVLSELDKND